MVIVATLVVAASCGGGDEAGAMATSEELRVEDAWAARTPASEHVPIYMTINNDADEPQTLAKIEAPQCSAVEVHAMSVGGATPSEPVDSVIVIPPNARITLGPETILLLCLEPSVAVREGEVLSLELTVGSGATIDVDAEVRTP